MKRLFATLFVLLAVIFNVNGQNKVNYLQDGIKAFDEKKYDESERLLLKDGSETAYCYLGLVFYSKIEDCEYDKRFALFSKSEEYLRKAIELDKAVNGWQYRLMALLYENYSYLDEANRDEKEDMVNVLYQQAAERGDGYGKFKVTLSQMRYDIPLAISTFEGITDTNVLDMEVGFADFDFDKEQWRKYYYKVKDLKGVLNYCKDMYKGIWDVVKIEDGLFQVTTHINHQFGVVRFSKEQHQTIVPFKYDFIRLENAEGKLTYNLYGPYYIDTETGYLSEVSRIIRGECDINGVSTHSAARVEPTDGKQKKPLRGETVNRAHLGKTQVDAVDIGLSVLWSSANLGASFPEDAGNYFAWGELAPKILYSWESYELGNGYRTTLSKYCSDGYYGDVDMKKVLESSDDAARKILGWNWRLPTRKEFEELLGTSNNANYDWKWQKINGDYSGYIITYKPNGNKIILPAAGVAQGTDYVNNGAGYFWCADLAKKPTEAYYFCFPGAWGAHADIFSAPRYLGFKIRAVLDRY